MKRFTCICGQETFFENSRCLNCGRGIGYDPASAGMHSPEDSGLRRCRNGTEYNICNWLLAADDPAELCRSCRITRVTPNLSSSANIRRWKILESAKRRLLYSLLDLGLPVEADAAHGHPGLCFEFLEDRGTNPLVEEEYVRTGHATGVITINVSEADDVQREVTRSLMNEAYRTPLGHCRHESGHYYFDRLIRDTDLLTDFSALFGDAERDYESALADYYSSPPAYDPDGGYISLYAQSHPLEDWAECWAHYLHIYDTLETATAFGTIRPQHDETGFDGWIREWLRLSVILNELNRSMGLADAYPFVLSAPMIDKLRFIHRVAGRQTPS